MEDGTPVLTYRRKVAIEHPNTGEMSWFNHGVFFNIHGMDRHLRETFLRSFEKHELPYNTYYGDGEEIEPETIATIMNVYRKHAVLIPYEACDVVVIENMLVAHGRSPFEGLRRVLVSMTGTVQLGTVKAM